MLEKTTRMNYLYDFYQDLLTPKQKKYLSLYYLHDLSFGEIAEQFQVSRQAVYDNIKRTETMLETYEKKLKLYKKFSQRKELLTKLTGLLEKHMNKDEHEEIFSIINKMKELD